MRGIDTDLKILFRKTGVRNLMKIRTWRSTDSQIFRHIKMLSKAIKLLIWSPKIMKGILIYK